MTSNMTQKLGSLKFEFISFLGGHIRETPVASNLSVSHLDDHIWCKGKELLVPGIFQLEILKTTLVGYFKWWNLGGKYGATIWKNVAAMYRLPVCIPLYWNLLSKQKDASTHGSDLSQTSKSFRCQIHECHDDLGEKPAVLDMFLSLFPHLFVSNPASKSPTEGRLFTSFFQRENHLKSLTQRISFVASAKQKNLPTKKQGSLETNMSPTCLLSLANDFLLMISDPTLCGKKTPNSNIDNWKPLFFISSWIKHRCTRWVL